jgi:putrescine transport system substrate-binding protein
LLVLPYIKTMNYDFSSKEKHSLHAPEPNTWTRRKWVGSVFAGLMTAGCSRLRMNSEKPTLNVIAVEEFTSPEVFKSFEDVTGIQIKLTLVGSNPEFMDIMTSEKTKVRYDLAYLSASALAPELLARKLLSPFSSKSLPNIAYIDEKWIRKIENGSLFAVPYCWSSTGIGYKEDTLSSIPKIWNDFFGSTLTNRNRQQPRLSCIDDPRVALGTALISMGMSPNPTSMSDIRKASVKLRSIRPRIVDFDVKNTDLTILNEKADLALMPSGNVWQRIGMARKNNSILYDEYNIGNTELKSDSLENKKSVLKLRMSIPVEGSLSLTYSFLMLKSCGSATDAEAFVNYLLKPTNAAASTNYTFTANTIPKSRALIDPLIMNGPSYFDNSSGRDLVLDYLPEYSSDLFRAIWKKYKAGVLL